MNADPRRRDLAAALRLAAHFGLNEGICNHFSLQLPDGGFLLNPHGKHWSQLRASDLLHIDPAAPDPAAELTALVIHGAIHRAHPHATCVMHTHMPHATALTGLEEGRLEFVHQNSLRFHGDVSYDDEYAGLAESEGEGARIAACMAHRRVLFMANHGVIVTGASVAETFDRLYYLERACQVQVLAMSTGRPLRRIGANLAARTRAEFDAEADYSAAHFDALKALLPDDYAD